MTKATADQRLRQARLSKARRDASKELKLPLAHWAVRRTAILNIAHENLEQALCEGHRVDIGDLLKIEDALQAIRATLPPPKVEVEIQLVGRDGDKTDLSWSDTPAAQIEGKAIETKPADKPIEAEPEVSTPAPAPPPPPPPRLDPGVASGSDFHNQIVGGERAPLKRLENVTLQNNGHARSGAFNGSGSLCFVTSGNGRGPVAPDANPNFNSDGTPRVPYKPSH